MADIMEILNSDDSRMHFIKGLINLSKAQEIRAGKNTISDEELTMLRNAMIALNIPANAQKELESLIYSSENIIDIEFESKKQALFFLREGLQICYVEGQYYIEEKEMMGEMAKKLGVSDKKLAQLEQWVIEGIEWVHRGDKLLEVEE